MALWNLRSRTKQKKLHFYYGFGKKNVQPFSLDLLQKGFKIGLWQSGQFIEKIETPEFDCINMIR